MVKAMKYWLEITELVAKESNNEYILTDECKLLRKYDPHFQNHNSIWILHKNICKNSLIWQFLFVEQDLHIFSRERIFDVITNKLKENGLKFATKTIKDSINTFINTYVQSKRINDPEDNIISPLSKLKFIINFEDTYRIRFVEVEDFSPELLFYFFIKNKSKIQVTELHSEVSKIMKIESNVLRKQLDLLENKKMIKIDKAAGLNNIINNVKLSDAELIKILTGDFQ